MKRLIPIAAVTLLLFIGVSVSYADIIFTLGNNPQPDEQNILFNTPQIGSTINGATQSGIGVLFSSLTGQTLYQTAQGQADIMSSSSAQTSALTSLDITAPGYGFRDFIMNPLNGSGTATVTVTDNLENVFTYDLGNGQNFLTITAINGQFITDIQIMMSGGSFQEFKQPRISGPCLLEDCGETSTVPEPTSLLLLGTGLAVIGLVSCRRRK